MPFDPTVLSWKDWLLAGFILGQFWNARSRRDQGQRLGAVERAIDRLLGLDDERTPSKPGKRAP